MADYTSKYIRGENFDVTAMINDDFVLAMKVLWNAKHYNSFLKLFLCFIDTMAYVSTGSSNPSSFKRWLTKYVDLSKIGVTPDELWEHRNAVLHLSTFESVKVKEGKVRKIVPYIGGNTPPSDAEHFYYPIYDLQMEVYKGVGRYLEEMGESDVMRKIFCDNYEKTISDMHVTKFT